MLVSVYVWPSSCIFGWPGVFVRRTRYIYIKSRSSGRNARICFVRKSGLNVQDTHFNHKEETNLCLHRVE